MNNIMIDEHTSDLCSQLKYARLRMVWSLSLQLENVIHMLGIVWN